MKIARFVLTFLLMVVSLYFSLGIKWPILPELKLRLVCNVENMVFLILVALFVWVFNIFLLSENSKKVRATVFSSFFATVVVTPMFLNKFQILAVLVFSFCLILGASELLGRLKTWLKERKKMTTDVPNTGDD